jgi:acid phosphatase type 7
MRPRLRACASTLVLLAALGPLVACNDVGERGSGAASPSATRPTGPPPPSRASPAAGKRTAVLAAAGDIACNPLDHKYGLGTGEETGCRQRATSDLIGRIHPDVVMPLGDTQYQHGTYRGYLVSYGQTWGRFLPITRPVIGNHEYDTPHAAGYFGYFGRLAGDPRKAYYSFDLGRWHVVVLNDTGCKYIGGCGTGSPEERWLRRDLAEHPTRCTLAAMHEPRWSSGEHQSNRSLQPMWSDLYDAGVDVVLAGHDHDYERFRPLDAKGRSDPQRGIRTFIVGTGGVGLRGFDPHPMPGSVVRQHSTFGVLAMTLSPTSYSWRFVPVGDGFHDSGRGRCH